MKDQQKLLEAVQLATRKLTSHGRIEDLLEDVLHICLEAVEAEAGSIYLHDFEAKELHFSHVLPVEVRGLLPSRSIPDTYGLAGEVFQTRKSQIKNFPIRPESERSSFENATGIVTRTMVVAPLMVQDEAPIGVVQLINKKDGCFGDQDVSVLEIVAAICTMGYINAQLSVENARASSLLGMGRVGHDIGNLSASLSYPLKFGVFLSDRIRTNPSVTKSQALQSQSLALHETLEDVLEAAERIQAYSQMISDLSAGKALRANFTFGDLNEVVDDGVCTFSRQAEEMGVQLTFQRDPNAPQCWFDRLFLLRIVQNLVGNALKAVAEVDSERHPTIHVKYLYEEEHHIIEVTDSGPGMTDSMVKQVLSGTATSRWDRSSGTGWGTRIVLELTATHGGKVEIASELGHGTTFRIVLPLALQAKGTSTS